jgi:hypothetical protein
VVLLYNIGPWSLHLQSIKRTAFDLLALAGNPYWRGRRLSTVDLLTKIAACFVKRNKSGISEAYLI